LSYSPVQAIGEKDAPIVFTSYEGNSTWPGVAIIDASGRSMFVHVKIYNTRGGRSGPYYFFGGFSVLNSSIEMSHVEVANSSADDSINFYKTWFKLADLRINNARDDGLDCDWSFGVIADSAFETAGGDCLDFSGSYAEVRHSSFKEAKDKGISAGEASVVMVDSSSFLDNDIGIAAKDGSKVSVKGSIFKNNRIGVAKYIKKPAYPFPWVEVKKCQYFSNIQDITQDVFSSKK